ncbi:transcriptional regulator [Paenibacillus sp. D2_2]|uniref:helix-turn-helix transcriptional regulator n=1 Tax=Paenibacillus sp. D2_2 TaxID=3073092 RepID=UPI0035C17E71
MANLREPGKSLLPELLLRRGITARDLSIMVGCTEAHISRVINGKSLLSYDLAAKVSEVLWCTMEDLHEWK